MRVFCIFLISFLVVLITVFNFLPISFLFAFSEDNEFYIDIFNFNLLKNRQDDNCLNLGTLDEVYLSDKVGYYDCLGFNINGYTDSSKTVYKSNINGEYLLEINCMQKGLYTDAFIANIETKISSNCPLNEFGDYDYKAFSSIVKMQPIKGEVFTLEEISYIFYKIVASNTSDVPINSTLEKIAFLEEKNGLIVTANISVCFVTIADKYRFNWLPESASFVLIVPFKKQNAKYTAVSDKIIVNCTSIKLPKALLVCACNIAFGKADYQSLFGTALSNVFINMRI